jgi:hypothetical protein
MVRRSNLERACEDDGIWIEFRALRGSTAALLAPRGPNRSRLSKSGEGTIGLPHVCPLCFLLRRRSNNVTVRRERAPEKMIDWSQIHELFCAQPNG